MPKFDPVRVHVNRIYSWILQPFSPRLLPGSVNISGLLSSRSSSLIKGLSEAAQPRFMMPWRRQSAPHITHLFSGINRRSFMVIPREKSCTGAAEYRTVLQVKWSQKSPRPPPHHSLSPTMWRRQKDPLWHLRTLRLVSIIQPRSKHCWLLAVLLRIARGQKQMEEWSGGFFSRTECDKMTNSGTGTPSDGSLYPNVGCASS